MKPAWERCVRCGAELAEPSDTDLPTCGVCGDDLRESDRQGESARLCPVDGSPLENEVVHMVAIDRCPTCRGVWLDGGELDLISRAVASGSGSRAFASSLVLGIAI